MTLVLVRADHGRAKAILVGFRAILGPRTSGLLVKSLPSIDELFARNVEVAQQTSSGVLAGFRRARPERKHEHEVTTTGLEIHLRRQRDVAVACFRINLRERLF